MGPAGRTAQAQLPRTLRGFTQTVISGEKQPPSSFPCEQDRVDGLFWKGVLTRKN